MPVKIPNISFENAYIKPIYLMYLYQHECQRSHEV